MVCELERHVKNMKNIRKKQQILGKLKKKIITIIKSPTPVQKLMMPFITNAPLHYDVLLESINVL